MKIFIVLVALFAVFATTQATEIAQPEIELCDICLQLMNEALGT